MFGAWSFFGIWMLALGVLNTMGLQRYKAKRDFRRTSEPAGQVHSRTRENSFVIQKHAASRLHYDFRLEMDGVLKSWAVPKGLPLRKGEKHLAVQVEDHPIEYANFEGIIAPGNYGAGTVMVWDRGVYSVSGDDPMGALKSGKIHLTLHGQKLRGDWTLVRMKPREGEEDKPQWLVFKSGNDTRVSPRIENKSVISSRRMEEIAEAQDAEWKSNRAVSSVSATNPWRRQSNATVELVLRKVRASWNSAFG